MKRILFSFIISICFCTAAFAWGDEAKMEYAGFSFGCYAPQDVNFKDVYEDERDTTFTLFYDRETGGGFGVGGSLMYYDNKGFGVNRQMEKSAVESKFIVLKAELSGVYRYIEYDDQLFVPQIKLGLNCTYFNEKLKDGDRTENAYFGWHSGFALLLSLDRLDPESAANMRTDFGVEDTYFFIAADYTNTDDFKERKLNLSGVEYSLGLTFRY